MKKLFLFLATVLLVGLTAQAMLTQPVTFQGLKQTVNNTSYYSWQIQSVWGQSSLANRQGSSYTFSNTNLGWSPVNGTVNGTLNFQEASALTDVITSGTFTVTFNCTTLWFDAATVKTGSGGAVTGCSVTVSSDKHTLTVSIPSGKTFGQIALDYVPNAPLSSSNTVISGIDASYIYKGSAIEPVPTVTYNGATLTAGTDYTVSYSGSNSVGTATLTVTGTGNYTGTVTKNYTIRNIALSDFRSLGSNTYEIASTTDLDNLALLVDVAENNCSGLTFKQTADIAYSTTGLGDTGENFTTIGGYFNGSDKNFCGTYDGQGHTISGIRLYKNGTGAQSMNQGLFGRINTGATIKNVILADARITGYRYVGGLVGNKVDGTVQNCLVLNSTITCADKYVGAICGKNTGTLTANYYHGCTVNGTAGATNVGVGGNGGVSSSSDRSGARSVHALTLPDGVTATGESVTIGGATYYAAGTTVTLAYNNAAYNATYSVNGNAITGNTFTMPAQDATVTMTTTAVNYSITYDQAGGALPSGQSNPTTYNVETPTFTLINPVREGYRFDGWTGSNGTTPQTTVSIPTGSTGDLNYTANWTRLPRYYTFDSETGALTLIWGEFNKDNKWGDDVTASAVKSVNATNEVSFTGDCSSLFSNFSTCESMDLSNVNTSGMTNCNSMFYYCSELTSLDLSGWNTGNVTNMYAMFYYCSELTSLDLSGWNTGNVTDMRYLFYRCQGLDSLDLSGWNTGNVTSMYSMFQNCMGLTSLDLSAWNTDNVTNMHAMFHGCFGLTSLDLSGFNTESVTDMGNMFAYSTGLTSLDLSGWNTGNVTNMEAMFGRCRGLTTIYAGEGWNTEKVTNSDGMFYGCTKLKGGMGTTYDPNYTEKTYARIDKGDDGPGYLTGVFALTLGEGVTATATATLTHGDVSLYAAGTTVTLAYNGEVPQDHIIYCVNGTPIEGNTFEMPFENVTVTAELQPRYTYNSETGALSLIWGEFNKDNKWGSDVTASAVKSVTATSEVSFTGDCSYLFYNFNNCESLDLNNVNTSGMTKCSHMFEICLSLTSLDLSGWNTSNVTDMCYMFYSCSDLTSLDLSGWNTANVTRMDYMFSDCWCMTSLDVSGWNTSNVTSMGYMFYGCSRLTSLDLSDWNTSNVTSMRDMFHDCNNLITIYAGAEWSTEKVRNSHSMFEYCYELKGGMGTTYDSNHIDAEYARIDGGPSNPGYFTAKSTALRGDVNGDGQVKISDVTALINYLLSGDASAIDLDAADCNEDGQIKISDVTALINYLLSGNW